MTFYSLTHGTNGVIFGYALTGVPMLAGLITRKASFGKFIRAPLLNFPVAILAAVLWAGVAWFYQKQGLRASGALFYGTAIVFTMMVGFLAGVLIAGAGGPAEVRKRGALVEDGRDAQKQSRKWKRRNEYGTTFAGVAISDEAEKKHFKILGTTGTGKSTAIRELIEAALHRGDRIVIADPDGGYLKRFYDAKRGDVILNPFDARASAWDLFAEIEQSFDVEQLARALIPDEEGSDRQWRGYARTFFTAVTRQLWDLGKRDPTHRSLGELYRLITMASAEELKLLVANTPAQPFLESGNERMFGSIRSVASTHLAALEHLAEQTRSPFSVRRWIRSSRSGVLFLPYSATQISALRSSISAWMRLAIFESMSGQERDQHLWFIVDELDALGQIDGLKDALARLRKFGGRCVLGFQSIAQVSGTYGQSEAQTIVENCGNTLILRCSASERGGTAQFASRLIGEREVVRTQVSKSLRPGEFHSSRTTSEHHVTELAVLPSEIEQLPDLQGYLKLAEQPGWLLVSFTPE